MAKNAQINVKANTKDAVKSVGELNDEINDSVKSINSLEAEFNRLSEEIASAEVGSEKFKELQTQLKAVDSELKDTKKSVEGLDFEGKAGEIGKFAGGIGAVGTALALSFGDNEDIEKFFQTFATGIAITQGMKGAMEAMAAAQRLFNIASLKGGLIQAKNVAIGIAQKVVMLGNLAVTGAVTAAQWLWNAAMTANPIGLIIVGVGALIAGIAFLTDSISDVVDWFMEMSDVMLLLLGPIGLLILAYKKLFAEEEVASDASIDRTKAAIAGVRERINAIDDEIDKTKELIKTTQHQQELQKNADELFIKQAKAKGASEKELFDIQKKINEQNLIAKTEEIRLENVLIAQQLNKADLLAEEGRLKLELAVQSGNITQQEADLTNKRIDDALTKFKESKTEELIFNSQILSTMKADNEIFENSKVKSNNNTNKKIAADNKKAAEDRLKAEILAEEKAERERDKRLLDREQKEEKRLEDINAREEQARLDKLIREEKEAEYLRDLKIEQTEQLKQDKIEFNQFLLDQTIELENAISDAISEIQRRRTENKLALALEENNAAMDLLNDDLSKRIITQEEYDAKKILLEQQLKQEEEQIKRKAFNREKAFALAQIGIELGAGLAKIFVANAVANAGALATPQAILTSGISAIPVIAANNINAGVQAGMAIATSGIQAGLVASQKFKAARGGVVPGRASNVDSVDALLAPGETVINSNSSSMFPQLLSQINQAGGGISLAPEVQTVEPVYNQNNTQTVKAYVVESEMTDKQKGVSRIERSVSFG